MAKEIHVFSDVAQAYEDKKVLTRFYEGKVKSSSFFFELTEDAAERSTFSLSRMPPGKIRILTPPSFLNFNIDNDDGLPTLSGLKIGHGAYETPNSEVIEQNYDALQADGIDLEVGKNTYHFGEELLDKDVVFESKKGFYIKIEAQGIWPIGMQISGTIFFIQ
jgi:hypothetical protein